MKKIDSLQGIRFYLAVLVFLCHLNTVLVSEQGKKVFESFCNNGNYAVTFFFVLSGFCMALGYSERFYECTGKEWWCYIKKRIIKIYPLYMLTMFIAMLCKIGLDFRLSTILRGTAHFLFGATMLQSIIVKYWGILNSVCWYISCIICLYVITPLVIKKLHTIRKNMVKLMKLLIVLFLILVVLIVSTSFAFSKYMWETTVYISPFFRVFYYLIGLILGYIRQLKSKRAFWGKCELPILIVMLMFFFIGMHFDTLNPYMSLIYVAIFSIAIFIFSYEEGRISKFFANKFNVYLGGLSMEIYMIHYLIVHYGGLYIQKKFHFSFEVEILMCILFFFITFCLAMGYNKLEVFLRKRSIVNL